MSQEDTPTPPKAPQKPVTFRHHGQERVDPYAWLRAENWQDVTRDPSRLDPEIRAYLEAENAYADAALADLEPLREKLFAELKGRIKEDDSTVPAPDGPFAYFTDFVTGGQHPRICRKPRDGGETEILLDGDALAEGRDYFSFGDAAHAPTHRHLAWQYDDRGAEFYALKIRDLTTGGDLPETIPDTNPGVVWAADGRSLFYVRLDENHRPRWVYRHALGTDPAQDTLVYEEPDPGFFVSLDETQSRRFLVIHAHDHETSEVHLLDLTRPKAPPRLVAPRKTGEEYSVEHHGERLFILTNAEGAEDFQIVSAPLAEPDRENWEPLIPHAPGRLILDMVVFARHLVRLEREDGLPRIVIRHLLEGEEHAISFAEEAYSLGLLPGYEFDTNTLRFTYSSLATPSQVYDYDMVCRERILRKTQEIPSGHDPAHYVTRRLMAPAHDGARVPVSLLYHKATPIDGSAPLLLYGYGAYGISMPAAFSPNRFSLVDRGIIYAIAHVRGGKEKGYGWYRAGKGEHKENTFHDFLSVARYLIAENYTAAGKIVAHGGSAGGMLMGVIANRAPELFAAIVAEVPFVDVLSTMLDDSLPLTPPEWPEWGNPLESPEAYARIAAYSPYDNVRAQAYPPMLVLAGLSDPRVTYWEPAKWVAKLRALKTDDNPLYLKTNMAAGHGGAAGRFERLKEVALIYAFILKMVDRADTAPMGLRLNETPRS